MLRFQIAAIVMIVLLAIIAICSVLTTMCAVSSEMRTQQFIERLRENTQQTVRGMKEQVVRRG